MTPGADIPVVRERRLFPRVDAAFYLGISLRSLDQLKKDGKIVPTELAGRTVYDRRDLDGYVERVKRGAA